MTSFLIWATLSAILAIIEVLTLWIWSICLAAGALAAGVASLCGASLAIQTVCAALGALAFFLAFGKTFQRMHERRHRRQGSFDTNMDELKGRRAIVIESTTPRAPARVRIDGDNWQVRLQDGRPLREGDEVEIIGYESIVLVAGQIKG